MHHCFSTTRTAPAIAAVAAIASLCVSLFASILTPLPAHAQGSAQFVFTGAGWGHGVGMSQQGARNMAAGGGDHIAILAHYYPNTIVSPVPSLDSIRVHIGDASRVELSSGGPIVFERGGVAINSIGSGSIQISAHDGGLQIGNAWTTAGRNDPLYVSFPQPVKVSNNGHSYLWGKFQLTNRDGKVRLVEVLPLEQYVAGISEMPAAWPLEALMAQAIAARTYAHEVTLHRRSSAEWDQEYDISGTTIDQNYIGWDAQDGAWDAKWTAVVKATAGVEIVDRNGPIRAYYSASNGGYTETAAYVFDNDVPYTVSGPDPYDAGDHNWNAWTRTYAQAEISRWLNGSADTQVGTLTAINVLDGAGASARLDKATVELVGTAGTRLITGKRLMVVINAGIFGEGGGLDKHLPGTFTTIGNGAGAGPPRPTGQAVAASVTPDPVDDSAADTVGFTPPPGWTPEPGTGVEPIRGAGDGSDADTSAQSRASSGYTPPPGWTPEPGTGVEPIRGSSGADGGSTSAGDGSTASGTSTGTAGSSGGYTPPAGWTPEPGTGIAPSSGSGSSGDAGTSTNDGYTPPSDWQPEPGSGVAPGGSNDGYTPPSDWEPEAGTGVAPGSDDTVGGTGGGYVPPPGWTPEPGTGVEPISTS